ncbi:MAG: GNAT family N-acetyltransferase [Bacteroidota bacterium]
MTTRKAQDPSELQGILDLQVINLKQSLSAKKRQAEGFLTVKYDFEFLDLMHQQQGHIVTIDQGKVVAYALSMPKLLGVAISILDPMFERLDKLHYRGQALNQSTYYIMGQVCIAENYRGQGIFQQLYQGHKDCFQNDFDYCITMVSIKNRRSIRAHQKVGFKTIHAFSDKTDDWEIILWDWS